MGVDKALVSVDGEPLLQRQVRLLRALQPREIFIAGRSFSQSDVRSLADVEPEIGPLGGLLAALRVCRAPFLLALAVDLPAMTADYLRDLLKACAPGRGVVPRTDRLEPLAAVYPVTVRDLAEEQWRRREFSLNRLVERGLAGSLLTPHHVDPVLRPLFFNLNTPADLGRLP